MENNTDPRNTGVVGLKSPLTNVNDTAIDYDALSKQALLEAYRGNVAVSDYDLTTPGTYKGTYLENYGSSKYDEPLTYEPTQEDVQELRYENQPWYDVLANGIGKMLGTAGTTFISSIIGLPYGLFQAANDGKWSSMWNNDLQKTLSDADKWLEENMTNYQSQAQQEAKWYQRMGDMNWWADNVIKNVGFTLGAAGAMATGAGGVGLLTKSLGLVNNITKTGKIASNVASALFSATGEGMIEAKQGVEERNKLETQKLNDALAPEYTALKEQMAEAEQMYRLTGDYNLYKNQLSELQKQKALLDQRKEAGLAEIEESGLRMGNKILLGNQVLLTAGNLIQFSKGLTHSFENAAHTAKTASRTAAPFGVGASRVSNNLKDGYKIWGKELGRSIASVKGIATEGSEEMNQQWVSSAAGAYHNEKDVNDYWRKKLDPEAYRETSKGLYTLGNAISQGFKESWGDFDQWEQFFIGGLTGAAGIYMPSKVFNQDKTKSKWDPRRYGEWSGGAINDVREFNEQYRKYEENVDELNKILAAEDFPAKVKSMIGHTAEEMEKATAVEKDDKKGWKDADDKQAIHQMQTFIRAGKLDDLRAIIDEIGRDMQEGDIQKAIESTTRKVTEEEDKQYFDNDINAQIKTKEADLNSIQKQIETLGIQAEESNTSPETVRQIADIQSRIDNNQNLIDSKQEALDKIEDSDIRAREEAKVNAEIQGIQAEIEKDTNELNAVQEENAKKVREESPEIAALQKQTEQIQKDIADLNAKKEAYVGQSYFSGAFVDRNGNKRKSDEQIKKELKDSSKELNRKLDSYLESAGEVLKRSNGNLTKDQEDNLVYLHNLGKESIYRMQDIMSKARKKLPKKFVLKTQKTPEQLAKEYASSDLTFEKNEDTKEGYVEVDTSAMNDSAFADFFQREVMRGRNIDPELAETVEERAAREKKERNLSAEEAKKLFKERNSKKKQEERAQKEKDAEEQWDENWNRLIDNFFDNYKRDNRATEQETLIAFNEVANDLHDAAMLYDQEALYHMTFETYMANPSLVDRDKEQAEEKAVKEEKKSQNEQKFAGKDAQQIKEDVVNGAISFDDLGSFAAASTADLGGDEVMTAAKEEAKKAQAAFEEGTALKNHIDDIVSAIENPSMEMIDDAEEAKKRIDNAVMAIDDPKSINLDTPELNTPSVGEDWSTVSKTDLDDDSFVMSLLEDALSARQADLEAQEHTPETPSKEDIEGVQLPDTGRDTTAKVAPEVVAPKDLNTDEEEEDVVPVSPLTEAAKDTIENEVTKLYEGPINGTWRTNTTKHPYGKSEGKYHEDVLKDENSIEYKRSKAIYEYLESKNAFDRLDNPNEDRIKPKDTIHLMVKYFPEIYNKDFKDLTEEEKRNSLAIIMLNDNGEVLGDLPLAQFEPSYRNGNPTQQVKDLLDLQNKLFAAFIDKKDTLTTNEAVVDKSVKEGGLGLVFGTSKKPVLSQVKQVMRGAVPFSNEVNTLNDIAGKSQLTLGIKVGNGNIAVARGDKGQRRNIAIPRVGNTGQPFLLLDTPSGEKIAIPFYMKTFDTSKHINTNLYKILGNALYSLIENEKKGKERNAAVLEKNTDVLEGLLQVKRIEKIPVVQYDIDGKSIALHLRSLTNPNKIINVKAPKDANSKDIAKIFIEELNDIPINVSLQYINKDIKVGLDKERTYNYNEVIGEIADANLPKNTTHTVNGWFTIELTTDAGTKATPKITVRKLGKFNKDVNGRNVEIDLDKGTIVDAATGDFLTDEASELALAEEKAKNPTFEGKATMQVLVNGKTKTYDIKNKRFVTRSNQPSSVTATPQQPQPKPAAQETKPVEEKKTTSEQKQPEQEKQAKTIKEIEDEMTGTERVNVQNQAAWEAVPDELKTKFFNGEAALQISYMKNTEVIAPGNINRLFEVLIKANIAAKTKNMQVSEAPKPMVKDGLVLSKERERDARKWAAKNLPMLSSEERLQFVDKLARAGDNAGKMWGNYKSGVIEIMRGAPRGIVYHEAFHYVMDMILNGAEREQILEAAKKAYGESLNDFEAEEKLAEDFRKYALNENATGILGTIKKWIRKLLDRINRYNKISDPIIDRLFWKINNGEFAQKSRDVENYEKEQQRVLKEINDTQQKKYSWDNISTAARDNLKEEGIIKETYEEMSLEEKEQYIRCRG